MIGLRRHLEREGQVAEINIAPLIDMVFILLIFFVATTSFTQQAAVDVDKPRATSAREATGELVQVVLRRGGEIYVGEQAVSLLSLRATVRERLRQKDLPVLIVADAESRTRELVDVIDECKLAGATRLSLAAEQDRP